MRTDNAIASRAGNALGLSAFPGERINENDKGREFP